ncbi:hypothetical protein HPB52_000620 [Rhipicephalus sanguineus]|uniref:Uncharacterized protein n=1 Tax=Rhipicephalus sanguineus TaxID=34632 RepID=A0A9D4QCP0_RHISA|nr:hypothetical protein HPB52_000620 [Rhipicephalus sanguineus]
MQATTTAARSGTVAVNARKIAAAARVAEGSSSDFPVSQRPVPATVGCVPIAAAHDRTIDGYCTLPAAVYLDDGSASLEPCTVAEATSAVAVAATCHNVANER